MSGRRTQSGRRLGEKGRKAGLSVAYRIDVTKPIGSFKVAWEKCREATGVECRRHDMRHTFVIRLCEAGATDTEVMALAGHVTKKMLARYSHASNQRMQAAISAAFGRSLPVAKGEPRMDAESKRAAIAPGSPGNPPGHEDIPEVDRSKLLI